MINFWLYQFHAGFLPFLWKLLRFVLWLTHVISPIVYRAYGARASESQSEGPEYVDDLEQTELIFSPTVWVKWVEASSGNCTPNSLHKAFDFIVFDTGLD